MTATLTLDTLNQDSLLALSRQIAALLDPDALMDTEDLGAMLRCEPRYVLEEFVPSKGFPKPVRLTRKGEGKRSRPKWRRSDITAWIKTHVQGTTPRGGRPRNTVE